MNLLRDLPRYEAVLLLQGPVGPFFRKFARWLEERGSDVYKVNFNLGDDLFYPTGAHHYREPIGHFGDYLERFLTVMGVKAIFCFGEMRPMHQIAIRIAAKLGVVVWAFEEGFVRPGYITLENVTHRVKTLHYVIHSKEVPDKDAPEQVDFAFQHMAVQAFAYFAATMLGRPRYWHYRHHKPATLAEGLCWVRSFYRKALYRVTQSGLQRWLTEDHHKNFFLVPLQVHNDYAVTARSSVSSIEDFIHKVMVSFALHAPRERLLVFKHHPMDRGHKHYGNLIRAQERKLGLRGRVVYLHDANAPALMKSCLGVVVINSTIGMQALYHRVPVLIVGRAFYESMAKRGWGCLQKFWSNGVDARPRLDENFRSRLILATQIPGSFYATSWLDRMISKDALGPLRRLVNRVEFLNNTSSTLRFKGQTSAQRGVDPSAQSRAAGGSSRS